MQVKSEETRAVAYTYRYSSGPLIPYSATLHCIGIKFLLEYLEVLGTTLTFYLYDPYSL